MNQHEIKQTKANKEEYYSSLIEPLMEKKMTKHELQLLINLNERDVRKEISEISMFYPVISYSSTSGYRIVNVPKVIKDNDPKEIERNIIEIKKTLKGINNRIKILKKKEKPLIAALKVLEKELEIYM